MKHLNNKAKILMLASEGRSTNIFYNSISAEFEISRVIIEDAVPRIRFLKQRYKKVGWLRLVDQLLFLLITNKVLSYISANRQEQIMQLHNLIAAKIPDNKITRVKSINLNSSIELIRLYDPEIILVNGTRILSKNLLSSTDAVIVNIHAGITPHYRGVHGAYWAYVNREPHMAGVTLHYVDSGVDTGAIISQSSIKVEPTDNFATYPMLQLSEGVFLLKKFLNNFIGSVSYGPEIIGNKISSQWYHPGFFEYLYNRLFKGVK